MLYALYLIKVVSVQKLSESKPNLFSEMSNHYFTGNLVIIIFFNFIKLPNELMMSIYYFIRSENNAKFIIFYQKL